MGMDNITCPSKAPVAGCAVGVPASVRRRGFGPQLAAARLSCGLGLRSLGWLANAGGTAECGSSTARGNAVCGRTACTVWEGAGGNAPMMPSPMWIAGWHIGSAPLAYLILPPGLPIPWSGGPLSWGGNPRGSSPLRFGFGRFSRTVRASCSAGTVDPARGTGAQRRQRRERGWDSASSRRSPTPEIRLGPARTWCPETRSTAPGGSGSRVW